MRRGAVFFLNTNSTAAYLHSNNLLVSECAPIVYEMHRILVRVSRVIALLRLHHNAVVNKRDLRCSTNGAFVVGLLKVGRDHGRPSDHSPHAYHLIDINRVQVAK